MPQVQVLSLRPRRSKVRFAPTSFFFKKKVCARFLAPPFRKKSRSARLLGCERPRDGSLSLTTFCEITRLRRVFLFLGEPFSEHSMSAICTKSTALFCATFQQKAIAIPSKKWCNIFSNKTTNVGKENKMEEIMTDKQLDKILKMVSMILDGCEDLAEAKKKIEELISSEKN